MTALLPPGMQPRQNHATGIEVHRYSGSPQTLSSPNLTSGIAGTLSPARKVDFPELSPAGAVSVQGQGAEAHGSEAATPREAGEEQEGRDLQKVLARLSKKPDSTEFVYLRPYLPDADAPVSERLTPLNPYHIEVVTHSQVDPNNYLTMSSFGVTHFIEGQPNFTDLERWQWEHRIFMKMLQLKVFRKYRVWKSLLVRFRPNTRGP